MRGGGQKIIAPALAGLLARLEQWRTAVMRYRIIAGIAGIAGIAKRRYCGPSNMAIRLSAVARSRFSS